MTTEHEIVAVESPLYDDLRAVAKIEGRRAGAEVLPRVKSIERGTRHHPDGVYEDYEKVTFRRR